MTTRASAHFWADPLEGLPLAAPSPEGWARAALRDVDALLVDHAQCEQKAAASALAMIGRFPNHAALQRPLVALAQEELHHFRQVLDLIEARGGRLSRPLPDRYVRALRDGVFTLAGGLGALGDLLIVSAFVEARSSERFRLLAAALADPETECSVEDPSALGDFYRRLALAEGRHWELFRDLAEAELGPELVTRRIKQVAAFEAEVIDGLPLEARIH